MKTGYTDYDYVDETNTNTDYDYFLLFILFAIACRFCLAI